jgi:hypothetical protein
MTLGTAEECAGLPYNTSVALTSTGGPETGTNRGGPARSLRESSIIRRERRYIIINKIDWVLSLT